MSWKDILVFATGSDDGMARVRMAGDLALQHDADLEVCIPATIPAPFASGGAAAAIEVIDRVLHGVQEDAARAIASVKTALPGLERRLRVEAPEIPFADLPRLAATLARRSDIAVVGQPIAEDGSNDDEAILDGVLMRSGRPCLMLPRWARPRPWGRRALIAWKGASPAARAVHAALPVLKRADAVRIYCAGGSEQDGEGVLGLSRLAQHLARHGVRIEPPVAAAATPPGRAILAEADAWGADLIVMGAYGHSQFRERAIGGATRSVIRKSPLPVLLSH